MTRPTCYFQFIAENCIIYENLKGPSQTEKHKRQIFSPGNLGNPLNHFKGASRLGHWRADCHGNINVFHHVACLADLAKCHHWLCLAKSLAFPSLCDEMLTGLAALGWGRCKEFYCIRWFAAFMRPQDYLMKPIIPLNCDEDDVDFIANVPVKFV